MNFRSTAALVWCSQRLVTRNKRQIHTAYNPDLADHTTRRTTPTPDPHQSARRRMCHLYSAGLPPQWLVELQFRDRLCIDTRIVPQPIMPGFRSQACRLVKLKFRDCVRHRFRSSQPLRRLHLQLSVRAPSVLPAWRQNRCALSLAGVPCSPPPASGQPAPPPARATAS